MGSTSDESKMSKAKETLEELKLNTNGKFFRPTEILTKS